MAPIIRKKAVTPDSLKGAELPSGTEPPSTAQPPVTADAHRVWSDRFGRVAIRCAQIVLVLLLATVFVFALVQLKLVVIPLLIATIVASACAPLIMWLRTRGLPPLAAAWVTLLAGLIVLGGIVTLIVFAVRNQFGELRVAAIEGIDKLQNFLVTGPLPIDAQQIEEARASIIDFFTSAQFGSGALAGVTVAGEVLAGIILAIVILFFFLKDGDSIWRFFLSPFSKQRQERGERIGRTSVSVLGGYIRGTSIIGLVDATAIGLGLFILGVPLALPLAVIVFLFSFIPLLGATLAGVLAALVALVANGPVVALIVILIVIGVNQLEGNFLQPVVMAQALKLHPLVILVALAAGAILGGVVGAVLAVPLAAVGWAIVKVWNNPGSELQLVTPPRRRRKAAAPKAAASKGAVT